MQMHIDGQLLIEMNKNSSALVRAEGGEIHVIFPSLKALYLFHRQFKRVQKQRICERHPLNDLLKTLHLFYFINKEPIGEMGPHTEGHWFSPYLGFKTLQLDFKAIARAAVKELFNRN